MKQGEDSELSAREPEILKTAEYELMLKLIDKGLWRTVNLARALHVDNDTVTAWKKTERVIKAHQDAILKFIGRRKDNEKILDELEVETPKEDPKTLVQINYTPIFGGKSVKELPEDS